MPKNINNEYYLSKSMSNQTLIDTIETDIQTIIEEYPFDSATIADGTVGAPSLHFASDPDSGLYRIGANNIGLALGGVKEVDFGSSNTTFGTNLVLPGTGQINNAGGENIVFNSAGQSISLQANNVSVMQVDPSSISAYQPILIENGAFNTPSLALRSQPGTGIYGDDTSTTLGISVGGSDVAIFQPSLQEYLPNSEVIVNVDYIWFRGNGLTFTEIMHLDENTLTLGGNLVLPGTGQINNAGGENIVFSSSGNTIDLQVNSSSKSLIGSTNIQNSVPLIIDSTNAEALLVRKLGDTGDIFTVNTSTDVITMNSTLNVNSQFGVNASDITINEKVIIDDTDTEAFLVRKNADGGDVFVVNTTAGTVSATGPIFHSTGTTANPSITFISDVDAGFYLTGANSGDVRYCCFGSDIIEFGNSGVEILTGSYLIVPDASAAAPAIRWDSNTGLYGVSNTSVNVSVNGSDRLTIGGSTTISANNIQIPADGQVYNSGNDGLKVSNTSGYTALVENAVECIKVSSTENTHRSALHTFTPAGVANTTVDYKFQVGNGATYTDLVTIDETEVISKVVIKNKNGTAGAPSYTFDGNSNTGIYRSTTNTVGISSNGTEVLTADTTRISVIGDVYIKMGVINGTALSGMVAGDMYLLNDAPGWPKPIYYDGTDWRYFSDDSLV